MVEQQLTALKARAGWKDPLVIVGAGPVGLSAALGLAHYGIPCIVLDDGEGTAVEGSRAIFMERHTLEILGTWSQVGRQMAELGMTLTGGRVFFRDKVLYKTSNPPPDPNTPYPRFVNFPQNLLEHLQYKALQTVACCEVRWRHKVIGLTQGDELVQLEVETPDGIISLEAPYVLAADGPRSTLRHLLGLNFPGQSRDQHFLILDVRMQLETPRERWFWFDPPFNPGRTALLHPQPDSIYRLDYQLPPEVDLEAIIQSESLHERIIATVGERPYEIIWKSIYTYQQRMLERFRVGRIFFLGDAAHLMSPFGGRGLNSGVQDAWNLVWKFALVRAGYAPESLLETYHEERHAAAVENLRLTDDTMRFLVPEPGLGRWKRDTILRASLPLQFMRRHVNAGHMSSPFSYHASSITFEDPHLFATGKLPKEQRLLLKRFKIGPVAGALAPSVILFHAISNDPVPLFDCFGSSFVIFYFSRDANSGLQQFQRIGSDHSPVPVAHYLITPQPPSMPVPAGITVLLDVDGKGARAYAAGSSTLYIIRPDRHIAARRFECTLDELPALLSHALGRSNTSVSQQRHTHVSR